MRLLGRALITLLLALVVTGGWVGGRWLLDPTNLPLRRIELLGTLEHTPRDELKAALTQFTGGSFLQVPVARVRSVLEAQPWVARAVVTRRWPDTLQVRVEERRPLVRWNDNQLLDQSGQRFFGRLQDDADLARLQGPPGSEQVLLESYLQARRQLAAVGLALAELHQDVRGARTLVLRSGPTLLLGRHQFDSRLKRFCAAYRRALTDRAEDIVGVDLRYANGFSVRWKAPLPEQG